MTFAKTLREIAVKTQEKSRQDSEEQRRKLHEAMMASVRNDVAEIKRQAEKAAHQGSTVVHYENGSYGDLLDWPGRKDRYSPGMEGNQSVTFHGRLLFIIRELMVLGFKVHPYRREIHPGAGEDMSLDYEYGLIVCW